MGYKMHRESIRVPTQIHTRELDRLVAHRNMKRAGLRRVNKHDYATYKTMTGMIMEERNALIILIFLLFCYW